jgi:hypothetical protein
MQQMVPQHRGQTLSHMGCRQRPNQVAQCFVPGIELLQRGCCMRLREPLKAREGCQAQEDGPQTATPCNPNLLCLRYVQITMKQSKLQPPAQKGGDLHSKGRQISNAKMGVGSATRLTIPVRQQTSRRWNMRMQESLKHSTPFGKHAQRGRKHFSPYKSQLITWDLFE